MLLDAGQMINVHIAGIRIREPMAALTDLILSGFCFVLFMKLRGKSKEGHPFQLFHYFFLVMSIATLWGGIFGHAFAYAVSDAWKLPGWILAMLSVMLAERSGIMHSRPLMGNRIGQFFSVMNIVELVTLVTLTSRSMNFFFVEFHAFYGLLIVFGSFELYVYIKTKDHGVRIMLYSVCISAVAAAVHIGKLSINPWFNYIALAHLIMCGSALVLYTGIKRSVLFSRGEEKMSFL